MDRCRLNRIFVKQRHELPPAAFRGTYYLDLGVEMVIELGGRSATNTADLHLGGRPYVYLTMGADLACPAAILFQTLSYYLRRPCANVLLLVPDYTIAGRALMCYLLYDHYFDVGFSEARTSVHDLFPNIFVPWDWFLDFTGPPFDRPVTDILCLPK